jgi:hypothetical protein
VKQNPFFFSKVVTILTELLKYDIQDQQGKAAFNERNPHMTQQQEPAARIPDGT